MPTPLSAEQSTQKSTQPSCQQSAGDCPLCAGSETQLFHTDKQRHYLRCPRCELVFVPDRYLLDSTAEKAQYDLHRNHESDTGYCAFLSRLIHRLTPHVQSGMAGLDYGCGPGPVLASLLSKQGFCMAVYDPYYFPDTGALQTTYDFITCTEALEHAYAAGVVWQQLFTLLKPGGWLGIMTKRILDQTTFGSWHYKNDPTHVRFYSENTFNWIAQQYQATPLFFDGDILLMQKPSTSLPVTDHDYGTC